MATLEDIMNGEVSAFGQSPTSGTTQPTPQPGLADPGSGAQGAPAGPRQPVEAPAPTMFEQGVDLFKKQSPIMQLAPTIVNFLENAEGGLTAGGAQTSDEAVAANMLDQVTFGNVDNIVATYSALKGIVQGSDKTFGENFDAKKEEVNLALHHNRKDMPGASMVGDIAGGVLGGFGLGKVGVMAVKQFPALYRFFAGTAGSILGTGIAGGTQAALYRWNSDGSMEEVVQDGTYGAIGGMVIGSLMKGGIGGYLISKLKGNVPRAQMQLGEELYHAISAKDAVANAVTKGQPVSAMTPQDLVKQLGQKDPDLLIADVYPGLERHVRRVIQNDVQNPGRKLVRLRDLVAARNNAELGYANEARRVVESGKVFTDTEYAGMVKKQYEALQPQFEGIFQGLRARGVRVKGSSLYQDIMDAADNDPRIDTSASYFKEAMGVLKSQIKANAMKSPTSGTAARKAARETFVDPQSLHNIKREFGKRLVSKNADINRGNALIYDKIKNVLDSLDPDYSKLTSTYADAATAGAAYRAGSGLFGKKLVSPEDFAEVTSRFKSSTEGDAFVNGAKAALWNKVKGLKSAEAIRGFIAENEPRLEMLRAVLGDDTTQQMVDNLSALALKENTSKIVDGTVKAMNNPSKVNDAKELLRNMMIANNPGAMGAARTNAMFRIFNGGATTSELAGQNALLDNVLSSQASEAPQVLKMLDNLRRGGQLPSAVPFNAGVGGGLGGLLEDAIPQFKEGTDILGSEIAKLFGAASEGEQKPSVQRRPPMSIEQMLQGEQDNFKGR